MATTSSPSTRPSFRVRASSLTLILIIVILLFILNISITASYQIDPTFQNSSPSIKITYSDHCNSIVPESKSNNINLSPSEFLQLQNGYYNGGDKFLSQNLQSSFNSPKSLVFRTRNLYTTDTEGIQKVEATLIFFGSARYPTALNRTTYGGGGGAYRHGKFRYRGGPRYRLGRNRLSFSLQGFYSQSTGKLCMVGSASTYSKEGNMLQLSGVFKLNYPNNSTIMTSLITGTLESVGNTDDNVNYFEPISILAFSQRNYNYTLSLKEYENGIENVHNDEELLSSLGFDSVGGICSALIRSSNGFELEYENGCVDAGNCNILGRSIDFLPDSMSFSGIQCSPDKKRLRLLVGFKNGTYFGYHDALIPSTTLVGEGVWDEEKNQLHVIACRILNFTDSLASASVGNCSIRLSLRFPAALSVRSRSTVVGEIWSNKTVNESGYFDKVLFQSSASGMLRVQGLRYAYTGNGTAINSCMEKKSLKNMGKKYPDGYSYDMRFDMSVKDSKGKVAWGYSVPLSVGDEFYNSLPYFHRLGFVYQGPGILHANHSRIRLLNISYVISFRPPPGFSLAGRLSSKNMPINQNKPYDISAEGIYDTKTGSLCMMGCRRLWLNHQNSTISDSMDCNISISIQFPPLNSNNGETVKGSIQSTRPKTDSLHFESLELSSRAMYSTQAKESIWRMDLEITMVLISNTLACVFVGLQLYYVKKHPDVISSISIVMLVILTLGHMIPLVLNFEALFFTSRYRQHVLIGSGGWLEVNEVIVRVVTMVAFLLQFRLLQLTWSTRMSNEGQEGLWNAEKNSLCVSLPLFIIGVLIALMIHWFKNHYSRAPQLHGHILVSRQSHSILRDMRSYAGLVRDNFLLPQILLNIFSNSKDMALSPLFYFGTSIVRSLPHAYDLYRLRSYANVNPEFEIYAKHTGDFFSTAWDVIIICVSLLFAGLIYFQQRFGGRCILPQRFKQQSVYEMVPIDSSEGL
ncbi:hypothetical protein MKW98_024669 [Papaver atlanticum]|uniref:RING-type E3 ubiquitin transferase n=1 Tax=Papaver atlanticum TaxID=357466 RepID=A0AAD4S1U2_9MAGN|nr:hypothetical protein MKW98_024669 [Papaver atlanticum]